MIIGVPREIKQDEHRVSLVPAGAYSLVKAGHQVLIEQGAGLGSGIPDAEYKNVGAQIVADRDELFAQADMIIKVKEPLAPEYRLLRDGQILFTFLTSRCPARADAGAPGAAYHRAGLRDRAIVRSFTPALGANERSGWTHVGTGGCEVSGTA